jgi:hypothetical protein
VLTRGVTHGFNLSPIKDSSNVHLTRAPYFGKHALKIVTGMNSARAKLM